MFASIRRYRLTRGAMDELVRRVDDGFAQEIRSQPGFVSYEFVDCGGGEIMTISLFETAEQADHSRELAQRWTVENLRDLEFAGIEAVRGEVRVSRAADEVLRPVHAGTTSG
jgi:Antibiotic biosynthesis monooxygenase